MKIKLLKQLKIMPTRIILIIMFTLFKTTLSYSQNEKQETFSKIIITDATDNGVDVTQQILEGGVYTVFYKSNNDGFLYMANVSPNYNSQSYGPLFPIKHEEVEETDENYKADHFYFNWRYINDYDTKSGTAKVEVLKVYKPQGTTLTIRIITENLDTIIYKGYLEAP